MEIDDRDDVVSPSATLFMTGLDLEVAGEVVRSERLYRAAILTDPDCRWLANEVGRRRNLQKIEISETVAKLLMRPDQLRRAGNDAEQAITAWRVDHARGLYQRATAALDAGDLVGGERDLLAVRSMGVATTQVNQLLANLYTRTGRVNLAVSHHREVLQQVPDIAASRLELARLLTALGNTAPAVEAMLGDPTGRTVRDKVNFYRLRIIFDTIRRNDGERAALDAAARFLEVPAIADAVAAALKARSKTIDWLVDQGRIDRFLAPVADALHRGAAAQAVRALSEAAKEHGAALEISNWVMPDGEDAGHPVFHLVNPFFYLWAGANLRFDTQAAWQSEEAIVTSQAAGRMLESYPFWRARQDRALIAMRAFIAGFATPPRVLDLACGQGEWLRFMAESCGVPLENLHGVELHAARLTGANDLLREHFACDHSTEDLAAKLERNLEVGDLLELSAEDIHTRHGTIDVITLAAVTPVFDDQQLARFLALLAQIQPTYIVVVTQIKRWDLNHGRADEDAWFARHGFEVERQEWAVLPLHPGEPHMTYLPQKYWPNRRITIYRAAT